ncbi:ribonuclease H-like domain-containing protein [Tanacetum coccineum]
MSGRFFHSQDEIPLPPPPSSQTPTQQTPHTVSTIKLPILKKGEYDIWAMKMELYLAHTDYPIWEVIQNGNGPVSITTDTQGQIKVLPPRTAEEILARERNEKIDDASNLRFGRKDESKKMQKSIHKATSLNGVSTEDANQKFLRSLPSAWSQVSLIMRTKPGVDSLSFDDLYNNLRVFENDVKGSTASSSSTQNVAFVSENTSSTNDVSTAYSVSNTSGQNSQYEQTSSYSLLANQSSCPQLDHEDLEQLDEFDLEEMDLKWQVAMISMRMKKFYKKTGRKLKLNTKEPVGFDKTKVECYNCYKTCHFARECRTKGNQDSRRRDAWNSGNKDGRRSGKQEDSKALVTIDGEGVDCTSHSEEEEDYALVACNSSDSDTEVTSCSNECKKSYAKLKKLYDAQREQLSDASIEIKVYTQGLKKVEAQLVAHQQGQLWYEENIRFMKIDLDDKTDVLTYHKKLLAEAQKEKEDLKAKVEKWHNSSKNLSKLLNTQMSANDKFRLGYGDHRYDGILSYENEVLQSDFMNKESELEKQPLYDRFVTTGRMHDVPPPMTGNYMPSGPDVEIDYSQFTYGPKPKPVTLILEQPSFAITNKQVKTHRETVKNQFTHSKNPTVNKKGLGHGFTARACFVCGSISHLIRDCDFHEKRMAKQAELNNSMRKKSSQKEIRPIWNNVQLVNHKNQFVPIALLTRTGKIPVNTARASGTNNISTARHNFNNQTVLTNDARKISTVKPVVNTVEVNAVSAVGGKRETAVKPSDYPHRALKHKGIIDSGCSRHMTRNKAYLVEYQDFNGGPVAFGGSKGYIIGKGKIKTGKLDFEDVCFVKELQHSISFLVQDQEGNSNAKTPQQNGVAERKNRTRIEAAWHMLEIHFLPPNTFWAEAVSTACYVLNRYIRLWVPCGPSWNTIGPVGKFDGKSDKGFLVGYSLQSKAFRVYNLDTKRVEENLHITFLENKPNVAGKGPTWLFDLDYLTDSMNYQPVRSENQANKHAGPQEATHNAGTKDNIDAGDSEKEMESALRTTLSCYMTDENPVDKEDQVFLDELERLKRQEKDANDAAEALRKDTASPYGGLSFTDPTNPDQDDSEIPALEDIYQNPTDVQDSESLDSCSLPYGRRLLEQNRFIEIRRMREELWSEIKQDPKALVQGFRQNPQQVVVNFLQEIISWQCKKAGDNCGFFYTEQICCCCKLLWASFVDSKSNVRLWVQFHEHKDYIVMDAYEKKLIQVLKIHTDDSVVDLLTKAFDVSRFQFLVVTIGMINP